MEGNRRPLREKVSQGNMEMADLDGRLHNLQWKSESWPTLRTDSDERLINMAPSYVSW